jgi:hypothetical protein
VVYELIKSSVGDKGKWDYIDYQNDPKGKIVPYEGPNAKVALIFVVQPSAGDFAALIGRIEV